MSIDLRCPANYKSSDNLGIFGKVHLKEYLGFFTVYLEFFSNMTDSVYSSYPPDLLAAQQKFLVTAVKDWAIQNGLAVRPSPAIVPSGVDSNGVLATNAPVTLFPSPFPRTCFQEATALQSIYNELYAAITCDTEWLGNIVEG